VSSLNHTDNAENKGTTLAVAVSSVLTAPFTLSVASGTSLSQITLPFLITLAPASETEDSEIEVMQVTGRPSADTLTISERAVNGGDPLVWLVGDKVQVRMTGQNHEEVVEEIEALTLSKVMGNIIANHNYG
jgi:hypothetical protein